MGNASSLDSANALPPFPKFLSGSQAFQKATEKGNSSRQQISYAASGMRGFRSTMEDKHVSLANIPILGNDKVSLVDHSVFAVFDGHGGGFASTYLEERFLETFSGREELLKYSKLNKTGQKSRSDVNGVGLLKKALINTFKELDEKLIPLQIKRHKAIQSGKLAPPPPESDSEDDEPVRQPFFGERSGATCVAVILTPTHIICANSGDSRAILRRSGQVVPLSFDHKPSNASEKARIIGAGGAVKGKRVEGDLAVSRAFGDFIYKMNKELPPEKQKITAVPDVFVYPRDAQGDEFIVLACDGIWDVASSNQCSEFIQTLLAEGETDLGNICEEALDTCLERNSRDNMTIMIIGLPGMKADRTSTAAMHNALWGHRTARRARQLTRNTAELTTNACTMFGRGIGIEQNVCV